MPKFFFDIHCDSYDATDVVGESCANTAAARAEACRTARELIRETLSKGNAPEAGWIAVEDEEHRPVLVVPLRSVAS